MSWKLSCRFDAPDWPLNGEAGKISRLHLNDEKKGTKAKRQKSNDDEERLVSSICL
jgi:hypothetical protein